MAKGVNKVIIIGNLGADPVTRHAPSGMATTSISVATSDGWKDKDSGEMKSKTEWHKIVFFNKLAEISAQYLKKGSKVFIEGKLQTRKWTDKDGNDKYATEIIAHDLQMLDSKSSETNVVQPMQPLAPLDDNFDDEIPF